MISNCGRVRAVVMINYECGWKPVIPSFVFVDYFIQDAPCFFTVRLIMLDEILVVMAFRDA